MKRVSTLLLLALLAAGCTTPEAGQSPATPSSSPSGTPSPSPDAGNKSLPLPPPTDTIHLGAAPAAGTWPPRGEAPNETALPYGLPSANGPPSGGLVWRYQVFANNTTLNGFEAHVWVRVVETLLAPAEGPACAWQLSVFLFNTSSGGATEGYSQPCSAPWGPAIAAGDYELVFAVPEPLLGRPAPVSPGGRIEVRIDRTAYGSSSGDSVFILSGARAFDSRIRFDGLHEPVTPNPQAFPLARP